MKDISLSVPDKDYSFFMTLIKKLDFVQVKEPKKTTVSSSKQKFLNEFKEAVDQVNLAKQGKIKLKSAEQLLSDVGEINTTI